MLPPLSIKGVPSHCLSSASAVVLIGIHTSFETNQTNFR